MDNNKHRIMHQAIDINNRVNKQKNVLQQQICSIFFQTKKNHRVAMKIIFFVII